MNMNQHFTMGELFRFTLPTMGMMLLMSAYVMADGFFVSNWCGETALAAVNFAYPVIMVVGTLGFMMGTGGSAIVAKTLGEGKREQAGRQFSLLVYAVLVAGAVCAVVALSVLRPVLSSLGASGQMLELALAYGLILSAGIPATILQYFFQEFLVTAGKPNLGFAITLASGVINVALDALLIVGLDMGVTGAAIGPFAGEAIGGIIPLVYFALPNKSQLKLGRTSLDWRVLGHACANGSSEMVSNIAMSVVSMAYNVQLLAYIGEAGVAAYGAIMYVGMAFAAILMGFIVGSSPLMSFQYGARNKAEMRSLFRKSLAVVGVFGVAMFVAAQLLARPIAQVFVGYDDSLAALTVHAMIIYSGSLVIMGFNMYASALFTALGNGVVSAAISFVRTLICEVGAVFLLPLVLGADGIWWSVVVAELVALALSATLVVRFAPRYGYVSGGDAANTRESRGGNGALSAKRSAE